MGASADAALLAIDRLLPQTQCRRCGHDGCLPYAAAMLAGGPINRCGPGGPATIALLASHLGRPPVAPDPVHAGGAARTVATIDADACIGCTKCILACPVDAIVGAAKHQHHVLPDRCTGCELCLPPCPVDCIAMAPLDEPWGEAQAARARRHHEAHLGRRTATAGARARVREPGHQLADPREKARRLAAIVARAR